MHTLPILCVTTSLWNIGEAQTVTIIRYYFALCHNYCDYFCNYTDYSTNNHMIIAIIKKCFSNIALIAKQKWLFGMEFIAEIGDTALLGGISATIGNQCSRICTRLSSKGILMGASTRRWLRAWARIILKWLQQKFVWTRAHLNFWQFSDSLDLGWCLTCCHFGCLCPCWKLGFPWNSVLNNMAKNSLFLNFCSATNCSAKL